MLVGLGLTGPQLLLRRSWSDLSWLWYPVLVASGLGAIGTFWGIARFHLRRFSIRRGSGGQGQHRGGDGIVREIEFLRSVTASILSQRRGPHAPPGVDGGQPGQLGRNTLIRASGDETDLGAAALVAIAA